MNLPDCMYDYRPSWNDRAEEDYDEVCYKCGIQISDSDFVDNHGMCEYCKAGEEENE